MVRTIAAVTALIGWAALALQLALIIDNLGPALGLWRFAGFFTILTNVGVAVVASAIALDNRGALCGPRARLMAATSVAIVGIVYSFALRALWNPTGLQKLGSGLIDHSQKMTVAAMQMADMKVWAQRS